MLRRQVRPPVTHQENLEPTRHHAKASLPEGRLAPPDPPLRPVDHATAT
jgi:hypothetical protein